MEVKAQPILSRSTGYNRKIVVVAACFSCAVLGASNAFGFDEVSYLSGQCTWTSAYLGPPSSLWDIPAGTNNNGMALAADADVWFINPAGTGNGTLIWTGNNMIQDDSDDVSVNPSGASVARAEFGPGGVFEVYGKLFNYAVSPILPVADGLLFEGTVGGFRLEEAQADNDVIEVRSLALVTPVPAAQSTAYLNQNGLLAPGYLLSFLGVQAQQMGGPLKNFQQDIDLVDAVQWNLTVPEPATIVLVLGAIGLIRRRRS